MQAFEDGDLRPEDVAKISTDLGVSENEVIEMNRRMAMGGDTSLNVSMREDGDGQWQDWLVDHEPLQDERVAEAQESDVRHQLLLEAMGSLNDREKHILTERRLIEEPRRLRNSARTIMSAANASARSRCAPSKSCKRRCCGLPAKSDCWLPSKAFVKMDDAATGAR
jgi:DNA-directed RNA polymerase sigma subunit (sigma70/sigma32)